MTVDISGINDAEQLGALIASLEANLKTVVKERDSVRAKFTKLARLSEPFADQTTESLRDLIATERSAQITSWSKGIAAALQDEGGHTISYRALRAIELYSTDAIASNPRDVRASRVHKILDAMFQFDA